MLLSSRGLSKHSVRLFGQMGWLAWQNRAEIHGLAERDENIPLLKGLAGMNVLRRNFLLLQAD